MANYCLLGFVIIVKVIFLFWIAKKDYARIVTKILKNHRKSLNGGWFHHGLEGNSLTSGQGFFKKVREYFPFPIQAINTDNGSEYLLNFHKEVDSWGIPHYFTDPHCPKQNGRVERLYQTAEYEFFNYQNDLIDDLEEINKRCMDFNTKYNTKRFHRSLGYKTPQEVVLQFQQQKGELPSSIYPTSTMSRLGYIENG